MLLVYDVDDNVVATQTITHGTEAKTVLVNEFKDVVKVVLRENNDSAEVLHPDAPDSSQQNGCYQY